MAKFIGEVKVEQFLQAIIEKFPYEFIEKNDFMYTKQKNNAYYHIQAINLPFQNIEFYYLDKELKNE